MLLLFKLILVLGSTCLNLMCVCTDNLCLLLLVWRANMQSIWISDRRYAGPMIQWHWSKKSCMPLHWGNFFHLLWHYADRRLNSSPLHKCWWLSEMDLLNEIQVFLRWDSNYMVTEVQRSNPEAEKLYYAAMPTSNSTTCKISLALSSLYVQWGWKPC